MGQMTFDFETEDNEPEEPQAKEIKVEKKEIEPKEEIKEKKIKKNLNLKQKLINLLRSKEIFRFQNFSSKTATF